MSWHRSSDAASGSSREWGRTKWSVSARSGGMRFGACSCDGGQLRAVLDASNLESWDTAVFGDGDLDVLDDAVRQKDHRVLAGVERGDRVVRGHSLNVE